jgi:hypothetical protein
MKLSALSSTLLLALVPSFASARAVSSSSSSSSSPAGLVRRAPTLTHQADYSMHAGTYPRITRLSDNSLLGTVTNFNSGTTRLMALKSTNEGQTWDELGIIASAPTATRDLDNPYTLQIPADDDRILAAFRNHDKVDGGYTWYRITLCQSTDGGASWEYVTQVWESGNSDSGAKTGAWEPFMRLADGADTTVQMYYSEENSSADQDSILRTSSDVGSYKSWDAAVTVTGGSVTARDGMIGVAELDGRLYMVFESQPSGHFQVFMMESGNGGASWENRRVIHDPQCSGTCNSGAPQIVTVGSTLVVSFMTDEDGPLGSWPSNGSAKLIASSDSGVSWSDATLVNGEGSMWPGLFNLDDESFFITYEYKGTSTASKWAVA